LSNQIVRGKRPEDPFDRILRTTIRDSNLSYRARGVLMRLLSNVDGYRMSSIDLAREGKEGRDSIRTALNELKGAGYIVRVIVKNSLCKVVDNYLVVYDEPQEKTEIAIVQKSDASNAEAKPPKLPAAIKAPSPPPPEGKQFGNFKCEYSNGVFKVGPALLEKLRSNYPGVATETVAYKGIEGCLKKAGYVFKETQSRNQVAKNNWKHSRWLTWFFAQEQNYIADFHAFGRKVADEHRYGMR